MNIQYNISLRPFNTFGMDVHARKMVTIEHEAELLTWLNESSVHDETLFILGGGSNILFTRDIEDTVLHNKIAGVEVVNEEEDHIYIKAGAGVNWHSLVMHCVERGWAGMENLALIPGNVGASPMQNIGAYGVELKDVFHELEAIHLHQKEKVVFQLKDCELGYRESVFKNKYKGQFIITSVTYKLNKKPVYQTGYGAIQQELERMGVKDLSIAAIAQAVMQIRRSKLPDPSQIGNAGSFFKNPEIEKYQYIQLQALFPQIVGYVLAQDKVKLAAGWLIEQCGWKGFRKGDAGCHEKQALVLVNHAHAQGAEIIALSQEIIASVKEKFGVRLEREVNVY